MLLGLATGELHTSPSDNWTARIDSNNMIFSATDTWDSGGCDEPLVSELEERPNSVQRLVMSDRTQDIWHLRGTFTSEGRRYSPMRLDAAHVLV